jgi:hypothetical protein
MQEATTRTDAREKLTAIRRELGAEVLEREEVLRSMVLALIAGEHVLLLGPPGTAKSRLARSLCERISGASYFYLCLNRFSLPDEVFGPLRLSALREDRFELESSRGPRKPGGLLASFEGVAHLLQPTDEQRLHQQAVVRLSPFGDHGIGERLVDAPPDIPPDACARHHALGVVPQGLRVLGTVAPAPPRNPRRSPGYAGHTGRRVRRGGGGGRLGSHRRLLP